MRSNRFEEHPEIVANRARNAARAKHRAKAPERCHRNLELLKEVYTDIAARLPVANRAPFLSLAANLENFR